MSVFRVLQLSDPHLFATPDGRLKGIPTWEAFEDVLRFLDAGRGPFDLTVLTGDLAHDEERATYERFRDVCAARLAPLRLVPGNHEAPRDLREVFPDAFDVRSRQCVFAFDAGAWDVIGLDSHWPGEIAGRIETEQLVWLEERLAGSRGRPKLVCVHHPPVAIGSPWLDPIGLHDADPLCELLGAFEEVRVVACGHVHSVHDVSLGAARVLTAPATCFQFDPWTEEAGCTEEAPGFRVFELHDDGTYTSEVVRLPEVRFRPEAEGY